MKAIWNNRIIAQSADTKVVEGNHYFPADSVDMGCLRNSSKTSSCHWKGTAGYYDLHVNGETNTDSAWYYADPLEAAHELKGRIAFWRGVEVVE